MTFQDWLINIVETEKPATAIIAYNFGIFESQTGYTVYLIGSKEFDDEDSDWAIEEDYSPKEKYYPLPPDFKAFDWDVVQAKVIVFLTQFFESTEYQQSFFSKAKAITVGFDDGDLERLK